MRLASTELKTLVIRTDGQPITGRPDSIVYHWFGMNQSDGLISIPDYIELHSDRIRKKYVKFIYDLSEKKINGKNLLEAFTFKGYSLWWMTTIVEKNLVKSPEISDCIKLIALEEIILATKPELLSLSSSKKSLQKAIADLCDEHHILFENATENSAPISVAKKYLVQPFLRGFLYILRTVWRFWSLRTVEGYSWHGGGDQIFIFSQFTNLTMSSLPPFIYSKYWEIFPDFLKGKKVKMNFLNIFHFNESIPDTKTAKSVIDKVNNTTEQHNQIHQFLYNQLDFKLIVRVFLQFLFLTLFKGRFRGETKLFRSEDLRINFWPLIKNDWNDSLKGSILAENLFYIALIDKCMKGLPQQKMGIYLQENNGWERCFVHAWKRYQKSPLIGVPHATIRYWDLRYIEDIRLFTPTNNLSLPRPDSVVVNGPVARKILLESGYNQKEMIDGEALRYLDNDNANKEPVARGVKISGNSKKRILLCGDIDPNSTIAMLECVQSSFRSLKGQGYHFDSDIIYKSHPVTKVPLSDFEIPNLSESNQDLKHILPSFDIVIATDSTSAGVEAYLAGLNVIVFTYAQRVNFSPLKGVSGVVFVSNAQSLTEILLSENLLVNNNNPEPFFWTDKKLPKWSKIFKDAGFSNFN